MLANVRAALRNYREGRIVKTRRQCVEVQPLGAQQAR